VRVVQLWRYPVKSMRGERLAVATFAPGGIESDRRFMLIDNSGLRPGKPLTARQVPSLLLQSAAVDDGAVVVRGERGPIARSDAPDFVKALEGIVGRPVVLREDSSGANHDDADVLVVNAASLRSLEQEYGSPLGLGRFRASIVLDGDDAVPYAELGWPGKRFRAGSVELEGIKLNPRCVITTIDPETIDVDSGILRFIMQRHEGDFGLYCRVVTPGVMREGDDWRPSDVR
jgi:uncharacterized protein